MSGGGTGPEMQNPFGHGDGSLGYRQTRDGYQGEGEYSEEEESENGRGYCKFLSAFLVFRSILCPFPLNSFEIATIFLMLSQY